MFFKPKVNHEMFVWLDAQPDSEVLPIPSTSATGRPSTLAEAES